MVEDGYHDAGERRLLRLGMDTNLPDSTVY
jgi:hypothetical protein